MAQQNLDRAIRDLHYCITDLLGENKVQRRQILDQESELQRLRSEKDGLLRYSHHVLNSVIEKENLYTQMLSENSDLRRRNAELEHTIKSAHSYALADNTPFAQRMVHTLGPLADRVEDARKREEAAAQLAELQASTPAAAKSQQQPTVEEVWANAIGENPRVEEGALAWADRRNRNSMLGSETTETTYTGDRKVYPGTTGGHRMVSPQPGSLGPATKSWDEASHNNNVMESVDMGYDTSWQGFEPSNEMTQDLSMSISDFSSTPSV